MDSRPSYWDIGRFYIPLAMTGLLMSAGQPIVHAGLSRLQDPDLVLAAYSLAFYAAVLIESPIIMLFVAANALVVDERNYQLTKRCMLAVNVVLTAITALVALNAAVYDFAIITVLQYPRAVAEAARPALIVLILWPGLIGVRRYYNGILTRFGWTGIIGWSTGARIVVMVAVTVVGVMWFPQYGVLVGAAALTLGVVTDTGIALIAARQLLCAKPLPEESDEDNPLESRTVGGFFRFFIPLAITSGLRILARPLMLSGVARGLQPVLSLAAFPVALGSMSLLEGHLQMMQQVVVAWVKDVSTLQMVRRFAQVVAAGCAALLALVALSPLADLYHGAMIGLRGDTLQAANLSLLFLAVAPLLTGLQAYNQGLLIRDGRTLAVNIAALINLVLLVTLLNLIVVRVDVPGYVVAGILMPLALLVEVCVLYRWSRPAVSGVYRKEAATGRLAARKH